MEKSPTILIVDDSLTHLAVLQDALEERGFFVRTAQNGVEAIAKVYESLPNLILTDVMMPKLNGYHLCRLLKNDPYTAHIPIILLTNLKERHDRFWGENAGANLYLEKAANLDPILEAVESFLANSTQKQAVGVPSTPPELKSGDIQSRITDILDSLLYESTITNEILKLTGLAHNIDQLAEGFLNFLSIISKYTMAGLLLRDTRDKYILCTQLTEPVSADFVEKAKKQILENATLRLNHLPSIRFMTMEEENIQKDGEAAEIHMLQTYPIMDDEEFLASVTIFDKKECQLTEGTRHSLNVVASRFLIVMRYLKKFREIEEVKGDFVSMLVHDLRSPLTSISGFTDVLADGMLGEMTSEQKEALKNIQNGCERLLFLIDDILDLSKLGAGKMEIQQTPIELRPMVERIFADMRTLFAENGIEVSIELDKNTPIVLADPKQIVRVFTNLLSNAVKFTPRGGKITLSAEKAKALSTNTPGNFLQISISDTGAGIPLEQQRKLFTRYQQLPSSRMFRKGTGLGLAICKEIITLHHGEIWVESPASENGGSRFTFTLPIASC